MINVSELIIDPDFAQPNGVNFTRHETEVIDHRQRTVEREYNVPGIITVEDNVEDMKDFASINTERIHVFTYEKLLSTGYDRETDTEYQSDIVHFNGSDYTVMESQDNRQYGFYKSIAEKIRVRES